MKSNESLTSSLPKRSLRTAPCASKSPTSKSPWNASMPYPTWPFTQVDGRELEKLHRRQSKASVMPDFEEALI